MSKYLILSLKHSDGNEPTFWRSNDAGYTTTPFAAGIYDEEAVNTNPRYYNDGYNTLAIPFTDNGLNSIGFKCTMDLKKVEALKKSVKSKKH